jgi:anaerobic magnesium-protoporphyrin IX monomethyl ester cyclase
MPLNYPCLAAAIRRDLPEVEVKIIDCLPLRIGWKSLGALLEEEKPDVIGCGDEAVYQHEGGKVFALAKELNPQVVTVAGGHYHSYVPGDSLSRYPIDYVVRFEGEATFIELLKALLGRTDPAHVSGLAFRRDGEIVITPPRPLITDLDSLPMPAYDLMPVEKYAPFGNLWPRSATIEGTRGCVDSCKFCSLWPLMGNRTRNEDGTEAVTPCYRKKSPERVLEEIDILYNRYGRRYLFWIDPSWNVDPQWCDAICEGILKRGIKLTGWWAFLRADRLVKFEELGILEKMVRAGFSHALLGIERARTEDYEKVGKHCYTRELVKQCYDILRRKYPRVFRQGTFLVGIQDETRESMMDLVDFAIECSMDYPAFHTVTPVPGTALWEEMSRAGTIEVDRYPEYDWYTPIMPSIHMTREEIAATLKEMQKRYVLCRPHWLIRGLFSPNPLRRGIYLWFVSVTAKMMGADILQSILGKKRFEGVTGLMKLKKPQWYDE